MAKETVEQAMARARGLERGGQAAGAAAIYRGILKAYPANKRAKAALAKLEKGGARGGAADAEANLGRSLLAAGRRGAAAEAFARAVALNPGHLAALASLGMVLRDLGRQAEALDPLRRAVALAPGNAIVQHALAGLLSDTGAPEAAEAHFRAAVAADPRHSDAWNGLGNALRDLGRPGEAEESFRRALEANPRNVSALNNLGTLAEGRGEAAEATRHFEAALALKPDFVEAHRNLSTLKRYVEGDAELAAMRALYAAGGLGDGARAHLCFALAKAAEDMGDTGRAFEMLSEGNARQRAASGYDIGRDEALFARIREGAEALAGLRVETPAVAVRPVFILGMPRSGTTLVEQIVSSHSAVTGAGELPYLTQALTGPVERGAAMTRDFLEEIRGDYLGRLARLGEGRPVVTDKLPHNFRWIGVIAAAFPEAPIVHVVRDARAVCWSNYRQYFAGEGLGYSTDLADTVRYYRLYQDLMAFWEARLPGRIYRLDYEALTVDQEGETRALIGHLGLGWEDACLAPQENRRSVGTASQGQVRRKVYGGSSQAWRRYEGFIGGAFDPLGPG